MSGLHSSSTTRLPVAIIGGGLTGSALANALVKLRHIDVHVYESAPEFSERGASVVLSGNAIQALKRVVPSSKELLENAGGVPMNSSKVCIICALVFNNSPCYANSSRPCPARFST